jgi:hypothetical protein
MLLLMGEQTTTMATSYSLPSLKGMTWARMALKGVAPCCLMSMMIDK